MRLRDVTEILEKNVGDLKLEKSAVRPGNLVEVYNFQASVNAIDAIAPLGFLSEDIEGLQELDAIYLNKSNSPHILLNLDTYESYERIVRSVRGKSYAVLEAFNQAIKPQSPYSLSFKLPESYDSLDKVSHFFSELELSLRLGLKEDKFTVQAFDSGSLWVELLFENQGTLAFLGSIINASTLIAKTIIKSNDAKQQFAGLEDEQIKIFTDHMDKKIREEVEHHVKELSKEEPFDDMDPEDISKVEKSILHMGRLLGEGTTVTPALNAPTEVKESYPSTDVFKEIEVRVNSIQHHNQKKIEDHPENNDED